MRYVKGHGQQTRSRIVENASYGLRQSGAEGMSVVDLMKLVGLTHGGFYSHFDSREALFIEAFALAMDQTVADWHQLFKALPVEKRFDALVDGYLSARHRDDRARGCVLPALGADIARSSPKVRQAFARKFDAMIDSIRVIDPEKELLNNRPAIDVPSLVPAELEAPDTISALGRARRIRHLVVFDGGREE